MQKNELDGAIILFLALILAVFFHMSIKATQMILG
jgi:hypothetical protein